MPISLIAVQLDQPGLAERVGRMVHALGGNISTSRMVSLGGDFVIAALVTVPGDDTEAAAALTSALEADGFAAIVRVTQAQAPAAQIAYRLRAVALDHPGIVEALAATIRDHGGNIIDAGTDVVPSPWSGAPTFDFRATILVASAVAARALKKALIEQAAAENLDIEIEPAV